MFSHKRTITNVFYEAKVIRLFLLLFVFVFQLACSDKPKIQSAAQMKAQESLAKKVIVQEKIEQQIKKIKNNKEIPDWVPSDFPLPEKTYVVEQTKILQGGRLNLKSELSVETLSEFYLQKIPENGWDEIQLQPARYRYVFEKQALDVIINISKKDDALLSQVFLTFM